MYRLYNLYSIYGIPLTYSEYNIIYSTLLTL